MRPQPDCLTGDPGDAMVYWTGGLLLGSVNISTMRPSTNAFPDQYSLVLLLGPERNARVRKLIRPNDESEDGNLTTWWWGVQKNFARGLGNPGSPINHHKVVGIL
jgi:hypothetical protein